MKSENRNKPNKKTERHSGLKAKRTARKVFRTIARILGVILLMVVCFFAGLFIYCRGVGIDYGKVITALTTGQMDQFEALMNPEAYLEADFVEGFVQNEYADDSDRFYCIGETLFKVSNNSVVKYSSTGVIAQEIRLDMDNCRVNRVGKYMLVYNIGGQTAHLFTEDSYVGIALPDPVLVATVGYGGYMAYVLDTDSYASAVAIYDDKGKPVSTRYIQEDYVVWAGVSPDNSYYCIDRVSLDDLECTSYLEYNKVGETAAYAGESYSGVLIAQCAFASNGTMVCIAEDRIIHVGTGRKPISEYPVREIYAMTQSPEGNVVLSAGVDENGSSQNRIYIFDNKGSCSTFDTDQAARKLNVQGGNICAVLGTGVVIYDSRGQIQTTYASEDDKINDAILYRDSYLVVYKNTVDKRRF